MQFCDIVSARPDKIESMAASHVFALLCLSAGIAAAQADVPREVLLLARIKQKMKANLLQAPNYTCLETIEREHRTPRGRDFKPVDMIRLEVAQVDNKELFSWPGGGRFEESSLHHFISSGVMGNGAFTLHARALFVGEVAHFDYAGEEEAGGRRLVRYDFRQPQFLSGYRISTNGRQATVAWHGSFWADPETYDVFRIRVDADEIPIELGVSAAITSIDYERVRIGSTDALLPQHGELIMTDLAGADSRNRTQFSQCRQYATESAISFVEREPEIAPSTPAPAPNVTELASDLLLSMRLETPVDSTHAAVGDPLRAIMESAVWHNGKLLIPKGAVVSGRIRRMEKRAIPAPHFVVGIEFFEIEMSRQRARFFADLKDIGPILNLEREWKITRSRTSSEVLYPPQQAGVGIFFMKGERFRLPRGLRMQWKTATPEPERPHADAP